MARVWVVFAVVVSDIVVPVPTARAGARGGTPKGEFPPASDRFFAREGTRCIASVRAYCTVAYGYR